MKDFEYKTRIQGMLLGLHVGDSLGATLEFHHPNLSLSHREILGGGIFDWRPGQATDDTDLMCLVLNSFVDLSNLDINKLRASMIDWLKGEPFDVGNTTRAAIHRMMLGDVFGGREQEFEQGNGSLMRVAPLSFLEISEQELEIIVRSQTRLTHGHHSCIMADLIYVKALKRALGGETLIDIKNWFYDEITKNKWHNEFLLNAAKCPWENLPATGWVIHSIGVLLWTFENAKNFQDALIKVVNLGDDADTNGAIVGAFWGALEGQSAIPERWLESLEQKNHILAEIERLLGVKQKYAL